MLDPAIEDFFRERKELWHKKKIKSTMNEKEINKKKEECEKEFLLENWLPKAAKQAKQITLSTHPCTFSHPSARKNKNGDVTSVFVNAQREADGYLRSGNVIVENDILLGNAVNFPVYRFLMLKMSDSKELLKHIQENSALAVELLTIKTESYQKLKDGFLAMINSDKNNVDITSSKIKQVYFPVLDTYHQLSTLSNSGIIFELKNRLKFSENSKESAKHKRNNSYSENGYADVYNLTTIAYGGTKPQNISLLNQRNYGKAHLLMSMPPVLKKREIHFPKHNFFRESFNAYEHREIFHALHRLFQTDYNNLSIRKDRDYRLHDLLDRIIDRAWVVRAVAKEQYPLAKSALELYQKIWLCDEYRQHREEENDWLDKLCTEITRWIILSYEKIAGKQAVKLGEAERLHIHDIVLENKEALR